MRYIYIVLLLLVTTLASLAQTGQSNIQRFNSIDSARRVLYKDSLGLSDLVVRQLFELRNYFYQQSSIVADNRSINDTLRAAYIGDLRRSYMVSIKKLLGNEKYLSYLAFIQRRLDSSCYNLKPLTIE